MQILKDGLAANDANLIVTAITGNSPQDIAAEILELNSAKASAESELATSKTELAAANTELDTTKKDLADAIKLNDSHVSTIEALSKGTPAVAATVATEKPTFTNGGVEYGFALPAILHKGVRITPLEVCADVALQNELIKLKSGMIIPKA